MKQGLRRSLMQSFILIVILFFISVNSSFAQRPPVSPVNLNYIRIDFINPSARPAALGGAFIGAAQDESAAPINPAGLTYLKSAGATLNQRHVRSEFSEPEGSPQQPNFRMNFQTITFDQTMVGIFLPFKNVTFAAFRAKAFDSRYNWETRQFLTTNSALTNRQVLGGLGNFPGKRVNLDLEMVNDAVAVAFKLHKRVSFGFILKTSVLNFRLDEEIFLDPEVENGQPPRQNQAETAYSITILDERNVQAGFTFGLLTKIILDKLYFGAVINLNPLYTLESYIFLPEYKLNSQTFNAINIHDPKFHIRVPDTYGFGLYYIMNPRIRFTFDLIQIQYSDMLFDNDLNAVEDDVLNPVTGLYEDPDGRVDLTVKDETEYHFGVEYLFKAPKIGLLPLRFGFYTNPGHRIHAANDSPDLRRLYPEAKDRVHFTFGLGLVFNRYLKFDTAMNMSDDNFELFASALISIPF